MQSKQKQATVNLQIMWKILKNPEESTILFIELLYWEKLLELNLATL